VKRSVTTFLTVALLTCLIWIYADHITTTSVTRTVRLRVDRPRGSPLIPKLVTANAEGTGLLTLQVTFSGPKVQLEQLGRELDNRDNELVYYVRMDDPNAETLIKDTRSTIEELLGRQFAAVSVIQADPQQMEIAIDRLITVPLPIRVDTGTIETTEPVYTPREAKVTIARSVFKNLPEDKKAVVVNIEDKLQNWRGERVIEEKFVLDQELAGNPITTDPTYVAVSLQIKRRYQPKELELPVHILAAPDLLAKYIVRIKEEKIKVTLMGPADVMEDEEKLKKDVRAFIYVNYDDKDRKWFPRDVQFDLPEGIAVATDKTSRPTVHFQFEQRSASGTTAK